MDITAPNSPTPLIRAANNELLKKSVSDVANAVKSREEKQQLDEFNKVIDSTLADLEAEETLARVRSLPPDTKGGVRRRRRRRKTRRKKSKRKTKRKKTRRR